MSTKQHGELVRPGDEFNREPWYQCGQCGSVHGRQLAECDGLRKPFRKPAAMTTDPKMPEPPYVIHIDGLSQRLTAYGPSWSLPDGAHALITTAAAQVYAEALAAHRVAQERERLKARLLGMDDAVKGRHNYYAHAAWVLFGGETQPPETGKRSEAEAVAARPKRQYFYRVTGCTALDANSPDCICWHDEGTGPKASPDKQWGLTWRIKPPETGKPA